MQLKICALFLLFSISSLAPKTDIIAVTIKNSTHFVLNADGVVETFPSASIPLAKLEDIKKLQPLHYQEFIAKSSELSSKMATYISSQSPESAAYIRYSFTHAQHLLKERRISTEKRYYF